MGNDRAKRVGRKVRGKVKKKEKKRLCTLHFKNFLRAPMHLHIYRVGQKNGTTLHFPEYLENYQR